MAKILSTVLTITIAIICVGTVLVPTLSDATKTEETFTNEGFFRASETSDETVMIWNPSADPFTIEVNGEDISLDALKVNSNSSYSLAFSDDVIVRYFYQSSAIQSLQIWNSAYVVGLSNSSEYAVTITINDSGLTWETTDPDGTPRSVTHSGSYFCIDPDGDYVMKRPAYSAYINTSSTIVYAGGISLITNSDYSGIYFEGTVGDLTISPMNANTTASNTAVVSEDVDGYLDLAKLEKITFTTTYSSGGTDISKNQTYSYFLVPYEVTAELSQHLTSAQIAIIAVIPVLMICAILIVAVGMIRGRND